MTRCVARLLPSARVRLKWPNDVQVEGLKVAGLLAEYVADAHAVVMGAGLNLTMTPEQLPTEQATSLTLHGADPDGLVDAALSGYLTELRSLHATLVAAGFDAVRAGIRDDVAAVCTTIGRQVRVELPGGDDLYGLAEGLDDAGRLLVRPRDRMPGAGDGSAGLVPVAAGDVTHVRDA
jgi:BirA family biotin operon repressor/biotin-[acetyl-CoA-carboxylase] ligase